MIGKYGLDDKYKVVLTATADECIANLAMLDGVSTVFMSGIHSHDRNVILKYKNAPYIAFQCFISLFAI